MELSFQRGFFVLNNLVSLRRLNKYRRKLLKENLPVANNTQQTTQQATTDQSQQQTTNTYDPNKPLFNKDDVEQMSPGEVINYVYVNMPQNIDSETKQALLNRAEQLRKDAETGKDVQERARQILRSIGSNIDIGL